MIYLTLLRHGESEGNVGGFIQGRQDLPLTARGRRQAQALAERWRVGGVAFDAVITSPLQRARQTAEAVATALGIPLEADPAWVERCFGVAEGLSPEAIRQADPNADFHHPYLPVAQGAESAVDLYLRASQAVQSIARCPAGRYLVVSHGALLNMAVYAILGITPQGHYNSPRFRFGNTAFANFSYQRTTRQWYLHSFNSPEDWGSAPGFQLADEGEENARL